MRSSPTVGRGIGGFLRPTRLANLALAAVWALDATAAGAQQPSPQGPEFQVNSYTTSDQSSPAAAVTGQGNLVIAWHSNGSSGPDTSSSSIQAQRHDASGAPLGGEFQVNTYTNLAQSLPAVAVDGQGNFVIAWTSNGSGGTDLSYTSIQAQRYDADGAPLGGQFQINTFTTSQQTYPAVAADDQGNFVVVWQSAGSSGTDTDSWSIQARRYDANGTPLGGEFQVNTTTSSYQVFPSVGADDQGNFVVVWSGLGSSGTDTSSSSIQAQRYDAFGAPLGGEFQVNTFTTSNQWDPVVAVDGQGNSIIAWESNGSSGTDTSSWSVQVQRYDANGAPLGGEFQVNTYTTSHQFLPAVAADGQGNFVVAWVSNGSSGTDASYYSIQAQRYDADGAPLGGEFQANTFTTDQQTYPTVAADGQGNFVIAWASNGSSGTDLSLRSIQARRYDDLLRDGFEIGTTARWSTTVP